LGNAFGGEKALPSFFKYVLDEIYCVFNQLVVGEVISLDGWNTANDE